MPSKVDCVKMAIYSTKLIEITHNGQPMKVLTRADFLFTVAAKSENACKLAAYNVFPFDTLYFGETYYDKATIPPHRPNICNN